MRVVKLCNSQMKLTEIGYDVHFSDGSLERYSDLRPGNRLNSVQVKVEGTHYSYHQNEEGCPVRYRNIRPELQITPRMEANFERLKTFLASHVDVERMPCKELSEPEPAGPRPYEITIPLAEDFDRALGPG